MKGRTSLTVVIVGLALLLAPVGADAAKGPRASVASATACALDLDGGAATLVVTTTLTNKSSGGRKAQLRDGGVIEGTYKPVGVPKNVNVTFDEMAILPGAVIASGASMTITAEFDVCGTFELARDLNGKAMVNYGLAGGTDATRTVKNRCTDDPDTEDVDEGPIKVADVFDLIAAACGD